MPSIDSMLAEIKRGVEEILPEDEFIARLKTQKPLRIKFGMDPTAPDIHLGHCVILNKLRQLQDLGHQIILVIGDFTAQVGDPSGKNATRPPLSAAKVAENAQTYATQAFKILDRDKTQIAYNANWLHALGGEGMLKLAAKQTVARMLERDDFKKRYQQNQPIAIHEFLYPLLQGHDSVVLKADLELGGTDQRFNLLMGRELQKEDGQTPQCIMTLPLLEGLDGVKKMSKSANNYIGVDEKPEEMFGKIMSLSDALMWRYFKLLSERAMDEIEQLRRQAETGNRNPRDIKIMLAQEMVTRYHSAADAADAQQQFIDRFQKKQLPQEMSELRIHPESSWTLANVLKEANLVASTSEALRMIKQGAVRIDGERVIDSAQPLVLGTAIYQVGKRRFARITLIDTNGSQ